MNVVLWILQFLLGALFIFAGVAKFTMDYAAMVKDSPVAFPHWFFLMIGACEILGGVGLILPWLVKVKPALTPIAAALLVIIMLGATVVSAMMSVSMAVFPFIVGLLLAFIAYKRRGDLQLS